jgi:hypothetical protein
VNQWGPSHQQPSQRRRRSGALLVVWVLVLGAVALSVQVSVKEHHAAAQIVVGVIVLAVLAAFTFRGRLARVPGWLLHWRGRAARRPEGGVLDPLGAVRQSARHAGGVYLGLDAGGQVRFSRAERAVLLLGPPRSGKSSAVIIPAILSHTGPVISTSTKADVAKATRFARVMEGQVWSFDPTGSASVSSSDRELRWSPVQSSGSWDGAQLMARA